MINPENKKKVGRPQRYVFWSDWEAWLLKEWIPFKQRFDNDFPHLQNDVSWMKKLLLGLILAIIAGAVSIIIKG